MGESFFFISGDKTFELKNIGDNQFKWYSLIERGRRFTSKIHMLSTTLDGCARYLYKHQKVLVISTKGGEESSNTIYTEYQNFNIYGRFIRIEVWHGSFKAAVIIPEINFNSGWKDVAEKILRFLGDTRMIEPPSPTPPQTKSYHAAASIESWPELNRSVISGANFKKHPLYRSLVGTFNDPFHHSRNPETIQKWFITRWKITAGIKVTPLDHNRFLFELPSRQEVVWVMAGDWFWSGRHLSLSWWSPDINSSQAGISPENIWLEVFGIPPNGWSLESFERIGDQCGGFVGVDEDTKNRTHFLWARVCVRNSGRRFRQVWILN